MLPTHATDNYSLYCGDCTEFFREARSGFVDLTVTSPPYDNLRDYGPDFDPDSFDWQRIIRALYRITAPGGVVVWVVADATVDGSETGTSFKQALYAMACGFRLHDTMFYATKKAPLSHNRYEQAVEYMFVWSKGRPKATNLIRERSIYHGIDKRRNGFYTHHNGYVEDKRRMRNGAKRKPPKPTKIKSNLGQYKTGAGHSGDSLAFSHPATFPEALAHDHIISWSNPGDVVFDPLMGSGTTGKMALLTGRKFIGVEIDPGYFEIAYTRIANAAGDFVRTPQEKSAGQLALWEVGD